MNNILRDVSGFCAVTGATLIFAIITGIICVVISEVKDKHYKKTHPTETLKEILQRLEGTKCNINDIESDIRTIAKRVDKSQKKPEE